MTTEAKYQDEEWLREQYVANWKGTTEIAEECGCHASTVRRWIKKHDIELRKGQPKTDKRLGDADWLHKQYVEKGMWCEEIAEECGCAVSTVYEWLCKHSIETRGKGGGKERIRENMVADDRLLDGDWLREQYIEKRMSCIKIAKECGCSNTAVQEWLSRHDIEIQPDLIHAADERLIDADWLREEYIEKQRSGYDISEELHCGVKTVYNWLNRHDIEIQFNGRPAGSDHGMWKGGHTSYGPGWNESKRQAVRERDNHTCQDPNCSLTQTEHLDKYEQKLHVHHLRKARDVDDPEERNAKDNLITLCQDCHWRWEKIADTGLVPQVQR